MERSWARSVNAINWTISGRLSAHTNTAVDNNQYDYVLIHYNLNKRLDLKKIRKNIKSISEQFSYKKIIIVGSRCSDIDKCLLIEEMTNNFKKGKYKDHSQTTLKVNANQQEIEGFEYHFTRYALVDTEIHDLCEKLQTVIQEDHWKAIEASLDSKLKPYLSDNERLMIAPYMQQLKQEWMTGSPNFSTFIETCNAWFQHAVPKWRIPPINTILKQFITSLFWTTLASIAFLLFTFYLQIALLAFLSQAMGLANITVIFVSLNNIVMASGILGLAAASCETFRLFKPQDRANDVINDFAKTNSMPIPSTP